MNDTADKCKCSILKHKTEKLFNTDKQCFNFRREAVPPSLDKRPKQRTQTTSSAQTEATLEARANFTEKLFVVFKPSEQSLGCKF